MFQQGDFQVGSNEKSDLEIFICCRDLVKITNQLCVELFEKTNNENWTYIGKTENIESSQNPNFINPIRIKYIFEREQILKVQLKQVQGETTPLVGEAQTTLAQIFGSKRANANISSLQKDNIKVGNIILRTNIVKEYFQTLKIKFSASNIPDTRRWFWSKTSPFLKLYRLLGDYGNYIPVHQTEIIQDCLNPLWKELDCDVQKICNGDLFMPIKVELWDYESKQKQNYLGDTTFTLSEAKEKVIQNLKLQKKLRNRSQNNIETGILKIESFLIKSKYTFDAYRAGGLQLNLSIAIDFTESNKVQGDPQSLHFLSQSELTGDFTSPYLQAIQEIIKILILYDDDKKVAMYGFGCQPKMNHINPGKTVDIFNLNDNELDPEVLGIDGIVQCYINALPKLRFSAPSNLHEILSEAMKKSKQCQSEGNNLYQILLILTDGKIDDMENCIDDIIASSHIPLSIIIVGIGDADFKKMDILDNDDMTLVDSQGRKSQRDLVQFVPFKKYGNNPKILSEQVLEELPRQVEEYMELQGFRPNPNKQDNEHPKNNQQHHQVFSQVD